MKSQLEDLEKSTKLSSKNKKNKKDLSLHSYRQISKNYSINKF